MPRPRVESVAIVHAFAQTAESDCGWEGACPTWGVPGVVVEKSYLRVFRRHRALLALPVLLGLLVGFLFAFTRPTEYVAAASVWADTRVPEETTIGTNGGTAPPSAGQAALLSQLLSTKAFQRSVAENSPLAEDLLAADQVAADALLSEMSQSIAVNAPGPQLLSISVTGDNPDLVVPLAQAVLEQYERAQLQHLRNRAQAQVDYDQARVDRAANELAKAEREAGANKPARAQTMSEQNPVILAQEQYQEAQAALANSESALASAETTGVEVVDPPEFAYPVSNAKVAMLGVVGGAMAGATFSLLALIGLTARDRSFRDEADAADHLDLAVIGTIPDAYTARSSSTLV